MNAEQINVPGLVEASAQSAPTMNKVLVSLFENMVVLHVERPQEYLPFEGVGALDIGTRMLAFAAEADPRVAQLVINAALFLIDHVYSTRGDLKPAGGTVKHELIERHRRTLTQRAAVMLNSTREKKTLSNRSLARLLVEAMLKEVFT